MFVGSSVKVFDLMLIADLPTQLCLAWHMLIVVHRPRLVGALMSFRWRSSMTELIGLRFLACCARNHRFGALSFWVEIRFRCQFALCASLRFFRLFRETSRCRAKGRLILSAYRLKLTPPQGLRSWVLVLHARVFPLQDRPS